MGRTSCTTPPGSRLGPVTPVTLLQQSYDADRLRVKKVANGTVTFNLRSSVLGGQIEAQQVASGHDPKVGDRLPIQEMKITMGLSNILGTMGLGVRAVWAWVFAK